MPEKKGRSKNYGIVGQNLSRTTFKMKRLRVMVEDICNSDGQGDAAERHPCQVAASPFLSAQTVRIEPEQIYTNLSR